MAGCQLIVTDKAQGKGNIVKGLKLSLAGVYKSPEKNQYEGSYTAGQQSQCDN